MMMQGESRNGKEINWQEFQTKLLESDQVARLVVVNNKFARVIMKRPGAGGLENPPRASGSGAGRDPNAQPGSPGMSGGMGGGVGGMGMMHEPNPVTGCSQWEERKRRKQEKRARKEKEQEEGTLVMVV